MSRETIVTVATVALAVFAVIGWMEVRFGRLEDELDKIEREAEQRRERLWTEQLETSDRVSFLIGARVAGDVSESNSMGLKSLLGF